MKREERWRRAHERYRNRSRSRSPDKYRAPSAAPTQPSAVLYSADDLAKVHAPRLNYGDRSARKKFRVAYIKYVIAHETVMRSRPEAQRVHPRAVIECIKPSLLMYICKYELKRKDRADDPALVKAIKVHQWVMKEDKLPLATEDPEGIKKLRAIKIALTGDGAIPNVQTAFIDIDEIIRHHRLNTSEQEIIKWLTYNLGPEQVKRTVQNFLRKSTKTAKRASKKLRKFHRLLRRVAKQF